MRLLLQMFHENPFGRWNCCERAFLITVLLLYDGSEEMATATAVALAEI